MSSNKRAHFRLVYPPNDRPLLKVQKDTFTVIDLSEKGVRFQCGRYRPAVKQVLQGTIVFKDGKSVPIVGTVLRFIVEKAECVLALSQGVPLAKMMEEQRYLLKRASGD